MLANFLEHRERTKQMNMEYKKEQERRNTRIIVFGIAAFMLFGILLITLGVIME